MKKVTIRDIAQKMNISKRYIGSLHFNVSDIDIDDFENLILIIY